MAAVCSNCGAKLGLGRRLAGKSLCDTCQERTDAAREAAEAKTAAERAVYEGHRRAAMDQFRALVTTVIEDELLTEEEEHRLEAEVTRLGLPDEDSTSVFREHGTRLLMARMAAGRFNPVPEPAIFLKPRETALFEIDATLMKEVVHRETRGGYSGFSVPITKGIRYRFGSYKGHSVITGTSLEEADSGTLTITSTRAVFKGLRQSIEWQYSKLIGVNVFKDGLQIHVSNRKTSPILRVADGNLAAAAVNGAIQRSA